MIPIEKICSIDSFVSKMNRVSIIFDKSSPNERPNFEE
jgi:hypothetical protein